MTGTTAYGVVGDDLAVTLALTLVAIVATVIHYRPRMAIRQVGKALGLTDEEFARWDQLGLIEHLDIDGTRWYFKRAPSNLFLLSDEARFITGHTLVIDAGITTSLLQTTFHQRPE